jgi:hypothetical protein
VRGLVEAGSRLNCVSAFGDVAVGLSTIRATLRRYRHRRAAKAFSGCAESTAVIRQ